jgi:hypothetical protein
MGLISSNLDDAYKEAKPSAKKMEPGIHEATITKIEIVADKTKIKRPWVDIELVITLEDDNGGKAWHRIEVSPLADKDGNPSAGKLGYVKGQLENMGYHGKLSELEYHLNEMRGARARISVEDKQGARRPADKGGGHYVNREVYVQELLKAGVGGAAEEPSEDFVPVAADDDSDFPF